MKMGSIANLTQNQFRNLDDSFIVRAKHLKPKFLFVIPNLCNTTERTKRALYYCLNFRIFEHHGHLTFELRPRPVRAVSPAANG